MSHFRSASRASGVTVVGNDVIEEVIPDIIQFRQQVDRQDVIKNVLTCVITD